MTPRPPPPLLAPLFLLLLLGISLAPAAPRISEFMASNDGIVADGDGDFSDWIEIYNPDPLPHDLTGYALTDNPANPAKWIFPTGTTIRSGAYLLVFASGKDRGSPGTELHTNFQLDASGEYLALVSPDGSTILSEFGSAAVPFPRQRADISYGSGEALLETELLSETAPLRYLVPSSAGALDPDWATPSFDDTLWNPGSSGIGFAVNEGGGIADAPLTHWPLDDGFGTVARDTAGTFPGSLVEAGDGSPFWDADSPPVPGGPESSLRFNGTSNYVQTTFPGIGGSSSRTVVFWVKSTDTSDHGIVSWGSSNSNSHRYHIRLNSNPASGTEGAIRCEVGGGNTVGSTALADNQWHHVAVVFAQDATPNISDVLFYVDGVLDPRSGTGNLALDTDISGPDATPVVIGRRVLGANRYFSGRLADVAIYDVALDPDDIAQLANGTARPSSPIGVGNHITTSVEDVMFETNASLFTRATFDLPANHGLDQLRLFLRYDDGVSAFLNGVEVMRANAPPNNFWNATALTGRSDRETVTPSEFSASAALATLRPTGNVLALHGVNLSAADGDFLLQARLAGVDLGRRVAGYFLNPTPGTSNTGEPDAEAFVADTKFAPNRGFRNSPFQLEISSATVGASIYYTLDGSEPSPDNGTLYTGPLTIDKTETIRAAAFKNGQVPTNIDTHTYIFPSSVLAQSPTPPGFPPTWGTRTTDYEMDPDLIGNIYSQQQVIESLRSLPSISVVMDVDDLFDGTTGFYANSDQRGDQWEKPCSYEFFDFPDGEQTQLNGGIRAVGRASRNANRGKHNLRAVFRSEYGPTKLRFPLFPESEVTEFNSLILRGGNGDSWLNPGVVERAQYIRDQWHRDAQRATGQPFQHQIYAHLYLNGLYWGMYHIFERFEDDMLAANFGGREEDWDAIKDAGSASVLEVVDGDLSAWSRTLAIARRDLSTPRNYANALIFIDPDTWIDYFLTNFYSGNTDWDQSNWRAGRPREREAKWMLFAWDSERTDRNATRGTNSSTNNATSENTPNFPSSVHQKLTANEEYRLRFADRVRLHCFNGGTFTPEGAERLWEARANEIYEPLIAEAARWGDRHRNPPARRETHWQDMYDTMRSSFFPQRTDTLLSQLRARGLYPSVDAPDFSPHGGIFARAGEVTIEAPTGGSIYYTTDGSDPRRPTTAGAQTVLLPEGSPVRAILPTDNSLGLDWTLPGFDDAAWLRGASGIGFELDAGFEGLFGINLGAMHNVNGSAYARWEFEISDWAELEAITSLTLRVRYDDGFIAYLNGREAASANRPASPSWNSRASAGHPDGAATGFSEFNLTDVIGHLRLGTNVLAVHCLNQEIDSNDLLLVPELTAATGVITSGISPTALLYQGLPLSLETSTRLKARVLSNGTWSAITTAMFTVGTPVTAGHLAISEIHYNPSPGSPTEFLELLNISDELVDLTGLHFGNGVDFTFPEATVLAPDERILVVQDITAFEIAYGLDLPIAGAFENGTRLSDGGERLTLLARDGSVILDFRFRDTHPWPEAPDGTGRSLVLSAPRSAVITNPLHWRSSLSPGGNPGESDTIPFPGGGAETLLAYALAGSATPRIMTGNDTPLLTFRMTTAADHATVWVDFSPDLKDWFPAQAEDLLSREDHADGTTTFQFAMPASRPLSHHFARLRVEGR
ncbi:MAG: lamin tail domain-containing protein [Roseibacillus sp.]|nr:lamin tail domain-containing protein [Roseibacillus sp.]